MGLEFVSAELGPKLGRSSAPEILFNLRRQRRELLRRIHQIDPHIVLLQYKLEQILVGGAIAGRTTVIIEHGRIPRPVLRFPPTRRRYLRTVRFAAAAFGVSRPALEDLQRVRADTHYLPAGVTVRGPTRPPPSSMAGLYAGRLEVAKGVLTAVDLVLRSPGVHLCIAGRGSLATPISDLARQHPGKIRYLGHVDNVDDLIQEADFGLLLTSDEGEGRPLFALECAARGRPVLSTEHSPAMRALQSELGQDAVRMIPERTLRDGTIGPSETLGFVPTVVPDWLETARVFEGYVLRDAHA